MVQANELRIGNYLKTPEGAFMTVKTLKQDDDDLLVNERNGMFTLNYTAFPIPLTEEILLKSEFDGGNGIFTNKAMPMIYLKRPFLEADYYLIKSTSGEKITSVRFLHEIQNFAFSITGKELEVKL